MPAELGQLTSLTHFYLSSNDITSIPPSFVDLVCLQRFAADDHVADDPVSATAVRRFSKQSVDVIRRPSGRSKGKIRLMKKLSARCAAPSPAPTTSTTVSSSGAEEKTVEELLVELGEPPERSSAAKQSDSRLPDKTKKKKGKKGKR